MYNSIYCNQSVLQLGLNKTVQLLKGERHQLQIAPVTVVPSFVTLFADASCCVSVSSVFFDPLRNLLSHVTNRKAR